MINNLNEKESQIFLGNQKAGRLGCVLENGEPYIVPVNYIFEDDKIYIHSLPGEKISAMKANPKVCLQTDKTAVNGFEWQSVVAFGDFEIIEDERKHADILTKFYKRFPQFTPVEAKFDREYISKDVIVFCINIKRLSGVAESY